MQKTILLVSGNRTLGMYLGILVRRMGFGLVSAGSGPDAVAVIGSARPDAIIIDSELAVFDGLDKLERVKRGGPSVPPIIMLVGSPGEEAERRCLAAGACTVITKPVSVPDLHQAVQDCMFMMEGMRRRHVRVRAAVRATVYLDGQELELTTESISAGGAFIMHEAAVPVGTELDVFLPLGETECLLLPGRVVYNEKPCMNAAGLCRGFAVEFMEPAAWEVEVLEDFVSSYMTEDLAALRVGDADAERPAEGRPDGVYSAIRSYAADRANA